MTTTNNKYVIFPAIGVARVGNSATGYYLAPEETGALPLKADVTPILPDFPDRDKENEPITPDDFRDRDDERKLCRQAARFRVYHAGNGQPVKPGDKVDGDKTVESIRWTVYLANKKAAWYEFQKKSGEHGYPPDHPLRNANVASEDERKSLIIDPGPRTITSSSGVPEDAKFSRDGGGTFPPENPPEETTKPYVINTLGEIRTNSDGALLVLGGYGKSGSKYQTPRITNYANNDGWWDDTSDGPVSATIVYTDTTTEEAVTAWVLVCPPAYAPQIVNLVTLYDTMFDVAVRHHQLRPTMYQDSRWQSDYTPDFTTEIKPILDRAALYPWVVAIPPKVHTFDLTRLGDPNQQYDNLRQYFLEALRAPDRKNTLGSPTTGYRMMPYLAGDDQQSSKYLTLTDTQYFLLQQWASGKFLGLGEGPPIPVPESDIERHPGHTLTRATLENCAGGGFSPGIEMTWICRNPDIYSEPFRIKPVDKPLDKAGKLSLWSDLTKGLEPGDVTKFMALPWQADFNECSVQPIDDNFVWWWPAQRPLFVYAKRDAKHSTDPNIPNIPEWDHVAWVGTLRDQNATDYVQFADDMDMVTHWSELGFVIHKKDVPPESVIEEPSAHAGPSDPDYIEVRRILERPGYVTDYGSPKQEAD
jgi:L-Lysine epsilon oxidase N-terminal/L-lysine epsilon oxidase C-terminal domain